MIYFMADFITWLKSKTEKSIQSEKTVREIMIEQAMENNLDPQLVEAVIQVESAFKVKAYRYEPGFYRMYLKNSIHWRKHRLINEPKRMSASYGLMQIMYTTAIEYGFDPNRDPEELYDVETNIKFGCKILKSKIAKYGLELGILSYNSGSPSNKYAAPKYQHNYAYLVKVAKKYKEAFGENRSIINYA